MFGLMPWTIESIKTVTEAEFIDWPDDFQQNLYFYILSVFELWKLEHGNINPQTGGLLSISIDFESAKPYQTAGIGILDNIDFALKLSNERYGHFEEIKSIVPLSKILALLLLRETNELTPDSIVRVRDFLARDKHINLLTEQQKVLKDFERLLPFAEAGAKFKKTQKEKARKSRGKVDVDGRKIPIDELVKKLAIADEHKELGAKGLWNHFLARLDEYHLNPIETNNHDLRKNSCSYVASPNEKRKTMTLGYFQTLVSRHRKDKNSH